MVFYVLWRVLEQNDWKNNDWNNYDLAITKYLGTKKNTIKWKKSLQNTFFLKFSGVDSLLLPVAIVGDYVEVESKDLQIVAHDQTNEDDNEEENGDQYHSLGRE